MSSSQIQSAWSTLATRKLPGGGFVQNEGGEFRPDATAWAVAALALNQVSPEDLTQTRTCLAKAQLPDGRVALSAEQTNAFWPTPLAIMAWQGDPGFLEPQAKAIQFLLATTGLSWEKTAGAPVGHDTSIHGWPWIANTHAWVEPTALCLLAFKRAGLTNHPRIREGVRLILDRQLPHGGWNYGNSTVFNKELHAMPWSTGMALEALLGLASKDQVAESILYLKNHIDNLQTPKSLGWAIRGLTTWGELVLDATERIDKCFARQVFFGPYTTTDLCILLTALEAARTATAGKRS